MSPDFWSGKRVFLTGHTGFKGSWLSIWLRKLGAEVAGYSLAPPTDPSHFELAGVEAMLSSHTTADVRDFQALKKAITSFKPDIVFHLAAQPLVRESYAIPLETFEVNVMGAANLLEALRATPSAKAVVIVTSDKCYENREVIWAYRETDAMGGHDPYSASKGCAELVTSAYSNSFFAAPGGAACVIGSGRAGNVIGGGDWAKDRLMADLMRGLSKGETVIIRRPKAVRPWQHVLEPLSGYLAMAESIYAGRTGPGEAWNFGPDSSGERTVGEVAALTAKLWGRPELVEIREDPNQVHEATLLTLDATKARVRLGWKPRWTFEQGIERTVEWWRDLAKGGDIAKTTLKQIEDYQGA